MSMKEPFWAVVDFLGHQRLAGRVSEVTVFGATMMQIEIPLEGGDFEVRLRGGSTIYQLRPCSEGDARKCAEALRPRPWTTAPQLVAGEVEDAEIDDEPDDGATDDHGSEGGF